MSTSKLIFIWQTSCFFHKNQDLNQKNAPLDPWHRIAMCVCGPSQKKEKLVPPDAWSRIWITLVSQYFAGGQPREHSWLSNEEGYATAYLQISETSFETVDQAVALRCCPALRLPTTFADFGTSMTFSLHKKLRLVFVGDFWKQKKRNHNTNMAIDAINVLIKCVCIYIYIIIWKLYYENYIDTYWYYPCLTSYGFFHPHLRSRPSNSG